MDTVAQIPGLRCPCGVQTHDVARHHVVLAAWAIEDDPLPGVARDDVPFTCSRVQESTDGVGVPRLHTDAMSPVRAACHPVGQEPHVVVLQDVAPRELDQQAIRGEAVDHQASHRAAVASRGKVHPDFCS
jgi:hypothetical protein